MEPIFVDISKKIFTAAGWRVLHVHKKFEAEALTAFFGASGSGKTTILRMIAGLVTPDEGRISVGDDVWFDSARGINLLPQKRSVGFVFQEYSLFPNMTVRENIAYAFPGGCCPQEMNSLLEQADLQELAGRYPSQLSGGQQQRVALLRALARGPRILLLDEPLSALDASMRSGLQDQILGAHKRLRVTTLMVSHDVQEVCRMADEVLVLHEGRICSSGTPQEIFPQYSLSSKFKFLADVVDVARDGFISVFSLRIGNDIVRVIDTDPDAASIVTGDRVVVASKAFNPVIARI